MLVNFRKYMIFGVLLLVLGVVVFLKLTTKPTPPKPTPSPLPRPSLQPLPEAPTSLSYSFEGKMPELPKKLPVYKIIESATVSLPEAKALASKFGFDQDPKTSRDIELGLFYDWATNDKYFSIGGKPTQITFGVSSFSTVSTQNAVLSTPKAVETAEKVLREKGLLDPHVDLKNPSFSYLQIKGNHFKEVKDSREAQIIKVSYNYELYSFPLINNTPGSPLISLLIGPKGELLRLNYFMYPKNLEQFQEAPILTGERALEMLKNQQGTIVYLVSEEGIASEIPPSYQLSLSKIKSIYLAYLYPFPANEPGIFVQPIFVFEGEGVDQLGGKTVKTVTFLPAVENVSP